MANMSQTILYNQIISVLSHQRLLTCFNIHSLIFFFFFNNLGRERIVSFRLFVPIKMLTCRRNFYLCLFDRDRPRFSMITKIDVV